MARVSFLLPSAGLACIPTPLSGRADRGFQANLRIITTNDEMLNELINLKR
jgi:hypothetical protein